METEVMPINTVKSSEVEVYLEPDASSEIIYNLVSGNEVIIDLSNSTDEFYKIYTAVGIEGFCRKDLVTFK